MLLYVEIASNVFSPVPVTVSLSQDSTSSKSIEITFCPRKTSNNEFGFDILALEYLLVPFLALNNSDLAYFSLAAF